MVKCTNVGGSQEGEVEEKKQHKEEGTSWVNNGG